MSVATHRGGRNVPCPCGSGLKAKRCHSAAHGAPAPAGNGPPPAVGDRPALASHLNADLIAQGEADFAASRFTAAATRAEAALANDPSDADALSLLGAVTHRRGRVETAGELLLAAIAVRPTHALARRRLAALFADMGAIAEAIGQLEVVIAVATPDGAVYADLAALHARAGRPDDARRSAERALTLDPDSAAAFGTLVELDMAAGSYAAARAGFEELAKRSAQPNLAEHLIAIGPVRSVRDWCRASGDPYVVARPAAPVAIARPHYVDDRQAPPRLDAVLPEAYLADIRDATVIGGEAGVLARDGGFLFDPATHPGADRYDLVRGAVRYMDGRAALIHAAVPRTTLATGVLLTGPGSHNYYHWLLEYLTRFRNLETSPALADWPLIVDRAAVAVPQLVEALTLVAGSQRDIVAIDTGASVRVDRLAVASPGAWLPFDLRDGLMLEPGDSVFDPGAVAFLRERLMPEDVDPDRTGHQGTRRIHLARSRPGRLQGATVLEPVLREFGFEDVLPETLTFAEQVRLFAGADVIVAESGAALTNLVFAPRSARIIVLGADRWDLTLFSGLAGTLGQELLYVAGTPIRGSHPKAYQVEFTLEPARLRRALTEMLG